MSQIAFYVVLRDSETLRTWSRSRHYKDDNPISGHLKQIKIGRGIEKMEWKEWPKNLGPLKT